MHQLANDLHEIVGRWHDIGHKSSLDRNPGAIQIPLVINYHRLMNEWHEFFSCQNNECIKDLPTMQYNIAEELWESLSS